MHGIVCIRGKDEPLFWAILFCCVGGRLRCFAVHKIQNKSNDINQVKNLVVHNTFCKNGYGKDWIAVSGPACVTGFRPSWCVSQVTPESVTSICHVTSPQWPSQVSWNTGHGKLLGAAASLVAVCRGHLTILQGLYQSTVWLFVGFGDCCNMHSKKYFWITQ